MKKTPKIGILTLDRKYPILRGNAANSLSYDFPVLIRPIPRLFYPPSPPIQNSNQSLTPNAMKVVQSAMQMQSDGVETIVMSCGFFALMQPILTEYLSIPVFTSPLLLAPLILRVLPHTSVLGILTLYKECLSAEYLRAAGITEDIQSRIVLADMRDAYEFRRLIEEDASSANIDKWKQEIVTAAVNLQQNNMKIATFLLECSDMPPFAQDIQVATKLPVYDYISMINWAYYSLSQPLF